MDEWPTLDAILAAPSHPSRLDLLMDHLDLAEWYALGAKIA